MSTQDTKKGTIRWNGLVADRPQIRTRYRAARRVSSPSANLTMWRVAGLAQCAGDHTEYQQLSRMLQEKQDDPHGLIQLRHSPPYNGSK